MLGKALFIGAAALLSTSAGAVTIVNGGFDDDAPGGSFTTSTPTGWTVTQGSVDHIGTYWQNQAGAGSVDLAGNGSPSTLSQALNGLVVGQKYRVSFYLAGNPDGPPVIKPVSVGFTGSAASAYTFNTSGQSTSNMGWSARYYDFFATTTSGDLSFSANQAGPYGGALDSVSIAAIPEPATWGMMILGFGMIGGAIRRRKSTAARLALV